MYTTLTEAISLIRPGMRIFIQGSAATPTPFLDELGRQAERLGSAELLFISLLGPCTPATAAYQNCFALRSLFVSEPVRASIHEGRGDYVPVFLSEIPELFRGPLKPDVALIQVSPPDPHGYCSLGVSVDVTRSAVDNAKTILALVNPNMPRTHGDGMIHCKRFSAMVESNQPLHEVNYSNECSEVETQIGRNIANLIEDGSTLQMGIGTIPDAVLRALDQHKSLGIHTEMLSDGVIPLIEKGIIDNSCKKIHPGKSVTGFCLGTRNLYDFVNDNPSFAFLDIDYVNDTAIIRRNDKVHAINSCIEIDLTGQVCSDSIGTYQYSGVGGQMDFIRGASLSKGGKAIIALPSTTRSGKNRIVPVLQRGAGVVTTRAHVHWVVTEYGSVDLFGKSLRERARSLIQLAAPESREELEREFFSRYKKAT